jgi:hypothetical protein
VVLTAELVERGDQKEEEVSEGFVTQIQVYDLLPFKGRSFGTKTKNKGKNGN